MLFFSLMRLEPRLLFMPMLTVLKVLIFFFVPASNSDGPISASPVFVLAILQVKGSCFSQQPQFIMFDPCWILWQSSEAVFMSIIIILVVVLLLLWVWSYSSSSDDGECGMFLFCRFNCNYHCHFHSFWRLWLIVVAGYVVTVNYGNTDTDAHLVIPFRRLCMHFWSWNSDIDCNNNQELFICC